MPARTDHPGTSAIVIGASMGGLLAARALADHFEQVTLLERDTFPAPGTNRKGVPQGKHTHVLLDRGRQILERFFLGLTDELVGAGAVTIPDVSTNVRWFNRGSYHRPGVSDVPGLGVSRPLLEGFVRQRVLALPNVHAVENCNVLDLVMSSDGKRVTGVRLERRQETHVEDTILADLVVDTGGRGSRSPAWLEAHGYDRPLEEEIRVGVGYTTCYYRRQPGQLPGIEGIVLMAAPPVRRTGVMLAQDGNRWVVTLGGYLGEHAPTDYQSFLEFARSLPAIEIYELIKDSEPLGAPVPYKFSSNLRRRYDRLNHFPERYLILGDALCSFNPIYGQGMTVAALEAAALETCLAAGQHRLAVRFFDRANKIIDLSWNAAVGNDLSFSEIEGPRTPMVRFLNWYLDKLHQAAHMDDQVSIAFLKVINMSAPPPSMLHPGIIWRVLKANLRGQQPETTVSLAQSQYGTGNSDS